MGTSSVCRLCLKPALKMHSLQIEKRVEMLFELTGIKIVQEDECPESCIKCLVDLKMAHRIQQDFIKNHEKFVNKLYRGNKNRVWIKTLLDKQITEGNDGNESWVNDLNKYKSESGLNTDTENLSQDLMHQSEYIVIQFRETDASVEDLCECHICGTSFQSDFEMYSHLSEHYKSKHVCEFCGNELENISSYREHLQTQHETEKLTIWNCETCQRSFQYKPLYLIHLTRYPHDPDENNTIEPEVIVLETKTAKESKNNTKKTLVKKRKRQFVIPENKSLEPFKITCECCNKVYTNRSSYKTHQTGSHKRKCPICAAEITAYNMKKHIVSHNSSPVVCHICGATAKNEESLRGHLFYTHSERQYPCEVCGKIFKRKNDHNVHVQAEHIGEKNFVCERCGKSFFTKYRLSCHFKSMHLKLREHVCVYCNKTFASRFGMRTHERQHTNEAPYVCDVCGEGFRQKVSLRSHRRSKHNIVEKKTVPCKECGKMFADKVAVKSHMRLHM